MRLLLKGWSFQQIANFQERNRKLVAHDVKVVEKRWRESAVANFNEVRMAQLARLDLLEREAWAAFERSKRAKISVRDRRRQLPTISSRVFEEALDAVEEAEDNSQPADERVEYEHTESSDERDGDPRWLERVAWCIQERNKMYALYPEKEDGNRREAETVNRIVVYLPPQGADGQQNGQQRVVELPAPRDLLDPSPAEEVEDEEWRPAL